MTLVLRLRGTFANPTRGKFTRLPNLAGALYAGYLLGTGYGADFDPRVDLSGNGHDLMFAGGGLHPLFFSGGQFSYASCPFDTADMIAAGDGVISMAAIVRTPAANKVMPVSNYNGSGVPYIALGQAGTGGTALSVFSNGATANIANDPARGNCFEFVGGVIGDGYSKAYRRRLGEAMSIAIGTAANSYSSANNFRIGRPVSDTGTWYAASDIASVAFYIGDQGSNMEEVAASMLALHDSYGLALEP